jgi:phospholipase C
MAGNGRTLTGEYVSGAKSAVKGITVLSRMEGAAARRRLARGGVNLDDRPRPELEPGRDTLSQISHVVILMMENHSYDNYLGMLKGHGCGLPLGADGLPVPVNPAASGPPVGMHPFSGTGQSQEVPTQSWNASHIQYAEGACSGFVRSVEETAPGCDHTVPMGYWTEEHLPYYYWLARTFPLAARWFCSCLGPTFPNRRFLIAGTAHGLIDDIPFNMIDYPERGTLFDLLDAHGISWANYHQLAPLRMGWRRLSHARGFNFLRLLGAIAGSLIPQLIPQVTGKLQVTADLYPLGFFRSSNHVRPMTEFWAGAAAGTLPSVSVVDPDFGNTSEENPQDIAGGQAFAAKVINAVMAGKGWPRTLLIWLYDEHGGYYDHVAPPEAVPPDGTPGRNPLDHFPLRLLRFTALGKKIDLADAGPKTYDRLGFRVPAVFVSPYARPGHVTEETYDHTSVLRFIERKWNLPPLTQRDAKARDFADDVLDFTGGPAFRTPPTPPELPGN